MKRRGWVLAVVVVFAGAAGLAQAPAGATGQCRDGSYTDVASRSGACRGHKGVQAWFAAAPVSAATAKPSAPVAAPAQAAGGPGMVWVNTATRVYHCPGTKFYGKTKAGKYMSEAEARASGARPERGKACSK
jgi:hypothetical protein